MNQSAAEGIIKEYIKPIYGFALKKCQSIQDAEDLSQEIVLKAYKTLLVRDDIEDVNKYIWAIAHNAIANFYRSASKTIVGVSIDEMAEHLEDASSRFEDGFDENDSVGRLQKEIAYLSKMQREIVIAFYFENHKQEEIAKKLNIPLGTVKWHIFEAKKELKRGMGKMREASSLKFNPVRFSNFTISGSLGNKEPGSFFRSVLSQNICYCVRNTAMSVNDIADNLGVSPVYVEEEADYLEKYGFLTQKQGRYIADFQIKEPGQELIDLEERIYGQAVQLIAAELFDELEKSGLLDNPDIICWYTKNPQEFDGTRRADHNFLCWSLIPYIIGEADEGYVEDRISFDEVTTIRPDGSEYIAEATILQEQLKLPKYYDDLKRWYGPMKYFDGRANLWQIDSSWSDRKLSAKADMVSYSEHMKITSLYIKEQENSLSKEEYAWLSERGIVKTNGDYDGMFSSAWQIVILNSKEIKKSLLDIGYKIKKRHQEELEMLRECYRKEVLKTVPKHLKKQAEYRLQYVFHEDGMFIMLCMQQLLDEGKLKMTDEEQRKGIMMVISQ